MPGRHSLGSQASPTHHPNPNSPKASSNPSSSPHTTTTAASGGGGGGVMAGSLRRRSSLRESISEMQDLHRSLKIGQTYADQGLEDALKAQRELRRNIHSSHFGGGGGGGDDSTAKGNNSASKGKRSDSDKSPITSTGAEPVLYMESQRQPQRPERPGGEDGGSARRRSLEARDSQEDSPKHGKDKSKHRHSRRKSEDRGGDLGGEDNSGSTEDTPKEKKSHRHSHKGGGEGSSSRRRSSDINNLNNGGGGQPGGSSASHHHQRPPTDTSDTGSVEYDFETALKKHQEIKESVLQRQASLSKSYHSPATREYDSGEPGLTKKSSSLYSNSSPAVQASGVNSGGSSPKNGASATTPSHNSNRPHSPEFEEALLAYKRSFSYLHRERSSDGEAVNKGTPNTLTKSSSMVVRPHHLPPLASDIVDTSDRTPQQQQPPAINSNPGSSLDSSLKIGNSPPLGNSPHQQGRGGGVDLTESFSAVSSNNSTGVPVPSAPKASPPDSGRGSGRLRHHTFGQTTTASSSSSSSNQSSLRSSNEENGASLSSAPARAGGEPFIDPEHGTLVEEDGHDEDDDEEYDDERGKGSQPSRPAPPVPPPREEEVQSPPIEESPSKLLVGKRALLQEHRMKEMHQNNNNNDGGDGFSGEG